MKTHRELYIKAASSETPRVIASIDAALNSGWIRDEDAEKDIRRTINRDEFFCYACDKRNGREAGTVMICRRDKASLYVSNVTPGRGEPRLDYDQYNAILEDLNNTVLSRINASFPVTFLLASNELHIENLMPSEAFRALQLFSRAPNKATGSSHSCDRERWISFLVSLCGSRHKLDSESLQRWLPGKARTRMGCKPMRVSGLVTAWNLAGASEFFIRDV
jgi:hypothetical protein